jgi:hypothetical protein
MPAYRTVVIGVHENVPAKSISSRLSRKTRIHILLVH